jgi:hypothetical protein
MQVAFMRLPHPETLMDLVILADLRAARIATLIGMPVVLYFFFWIRSDLRHSRIQRKELLRLWQQGCAVHTITAWEIMPPKAKQRFRPPRPKHLVIWFLLALVPLALAQQWFGILWLSYGMMIISPMLYVMPWWLSRKPVPIQNESASWETIAGESERRHHPRMWVTELPWWVHHAWRNYQFTQFWLGLGLYGSFFLGMGLLGLSLFTVLDGSRTLQEVLPYMGNECLVGLGLAALVLLILLPLRFLSRWQMQRWDARHSPTG